MRRLELADAAVEAALKLLREPDAATTLDDLKIVREGLRKLYGAGEDFIAAGAALRRWVERMSAPVDASIAEREARAAKP